MFLKLGHFSKIIKINLLKFKKKKRVSNVLSRQLRRVNHMLYTQMKSLKLITSLNSFV